MRTHANGSRSRSSNSRVDSNGLLVLTGYGLRLAVERGHLQFEDGIGTDRRSGRLSRATCGLKRLVILGHSGSLTLEALRWVHDVGASVIHIDADGVVIGVNSPRGLDDPRLRRAQAVAALSESALVLTRRLIDRKLDAQGEVLARHFSNSSRQQAAITNLQEALNAVATIDEARMAEASAAVLYWETWSSEPMNWVRADELRVPEHWRSFGSRASAITGRSRLASNPANALLNYAYAILEAEATIACLTIGLDPGIGFYHFDTKNRDSLACDLMETVRPFADELVLSFIRSRRFAARDFFEARNGVCRISAQLARSLAVLAPRLRSKLAPIAECLARDLLRSAPTGGIERHVPTLLSGENRQRARGQKPKRAVRVRTNLVCEQCGAVVRQGVKLCDGCRPLVKQQNARPMTDAGLSALAQLRESGADPAHGGEAGRRRGATQRARAKARREWIHESGADYSAERFNLDVLPHIRAVPLKELQMRTGLSKRYCSQVRAAKRLPHPRHWRTILGLTDYAE